MSRKRVISSASCKLPTFIDEFRNMQGRGYPGSGGYNPNYPYGYNPNPNASDNPGGAQGNQGAPVQGGYSTSQGQSGQYVHGQRGQYTGQPYPGYGGGGSNYPSNAPSGQAYPGYTGVSSAQGTLPLASQGWSGPGPDNRSLAGTTGTFMNGIPPLKDGAVQAPTVAGPEPRMQSIPPLEVARDWDLKPPLVPLVKIGVDLTLILGMLPRVRRFVIVPLESEITDDFILAASSTARVVQQGWTGGFNTGNSAGVSRWVEFPHYMNRDNASRISDSELEGSTSHYARQTYPEPASFIEGRGTYYPSGPPPYQPPSGGVFRSAVQSSQQQQLGGAAGAHSHNVRVTSAVVVGEGRRYDDPPPPASDSGSSNKAPPRSNATASDEIVGHISLEGSKFSQEEACTSSSNKLLTQNSLLADGFDKCSECEQVYMRSDTDEHPHQCIEHQSSNASHSHRNGKGKGKGKGKERAEN
ncbi:hypothetical protein D9757_004961 [Collybiopsis confluens]|uniref:Uncharacterized protein n=1 Tax=Collybiopsis confluens TaxID=2823264 RepID=A0A8H5HTU8_9AGAR|nr:hypothetical protein D9757_004961 [Collybiopsis confluens]